MVPDVANLAATQPNEPMHRMSAPPCQSKPSGFIGCPLSIAALLPALIGDLLRCRHHVMRDFPTFRRSAIRYWERRRIIYNVALAIPAFIGYALADTLNWVGDPHRAHYEFVIPVLLASAIAANICYSFSYALEFIFGSDDPISWWQRYGRTTAFVLGVLFAMLLALIGGRNIADMEWHYGFRHVG